MARGTRGETGGTGNSEHIDPGVAILDPAELGDADGRGSGGGGGTTGEPEPVRTRRGGWPKGKKRGTGKTGATAAPLDLNGLEGLLLAIHTSLAALAQCPELMLSPEEAQAVARSAGNVARHYNLKTSQIVLDWTALACCLATVYGTRFAAISVRKNQQKAQARARAANGGMMPVAQVMPTAAPPEGWPQ